MTDLCDRMIAANSITTFDIIRRFASRYDQMYTTLMSSDLGPPAIFLDEATSDSRCVGVLICNLFLVALRKDFFSS